jgi:23S rRNA (uracil1939-C5)-methyltransferase
MEVGEIYEGIVVDINDKGQGVLKYQNMAVFLDGGLPGDKVTFKIKTLKKKYAIASIEEIVKKAKDRIDAPCKYFGQCGGCQIQNLEYSSQLNLKRKQVENTINRIGGLKDLKCDVIYGMENPYYYRNKVQMPIQKINGEIKIGFFKRGTHEVIDIDECIIQHKNNNNIIKGIKKWIEENNIKIYDEKSHKGNIRHLIIKMDFKTEKWLLIIVGRKRELVFKNELISILEANSNGFTGLIYNQNIEKSNVILGKKFEKIYGSEKLTMHLGSLKFKISAPAFFQVNTKQTEKLYERALKMADLDGSEIVYDLYCGTGSISLFLAKASKKVIGIEIIKEAIDDARENAKINDINNVEFYAGDVKEVFPKRYAKGDIADVVVIDPPRKGCNEKVIDTICEMEPKKVVYISCNPATLARDIKYFNLKGYKVELIELVDLFAHSVHIESVVKLVKK